MPPLHSLPAPLRYFPLERGLYEVAPGLRLLSAQTGRDAQVLQFDSEFPAYRASKLAARAERLGKYACAAELAAPVAAAACRFIAERALAEHPGLFAGGPDADGAFSLRCALTGEDLEFDGAFRLAPQAAGSALPPYADAFDAVCSQLQEDVAVIRVDDERDWLAALHLCSPNHWSAEEKIGLSFVNVHAPIPGIEKINRASRSLIEAMVDKGPYVRFAWGVATDRRLNHHPEPPPGVDARAWAGRTFSPEESDEGSPLWLRVERQTLWGLPASRAGLFFIRTYFVDGREIRADARERALLRSALLSMTPESRRYKGVAGGALDAILAWLDA